MSKKQMNPKVKAFEDIDDIELLDEKQKEAFMSQPASRKDVTNFVDGYINNEVLPYVFGVVEDKFNRLNGMLSICQAILIESGVISQVDLNQIQAEWERNYEKQLAENTAQLVSKAEKSASKLNKTLEVVK